MTRRWVELSGVGRANWTQRPVAIVGGGPSLAGFDLKRLRDRFFVLAVNASIFDVPQINAGFSLDRRAMRYWWPRLREVDAPLYFAIPDNWLINIHDPPSHRMRFIRRAAGNWFNDDNWSISCGGSSGYGALQLAFKKGARRIVLLGFDYGSAPDGSWHHNEQHYTFFQRHEADKWREFAASFNAAVPVLQKAGAVVINGSPRSAITAFPRMTIEEALETV